MEIYFIRHGKTPANEGKLYCGQTDLPLSDEGVSNLDDLKKKGIYPNGIDLFFTSGLLRTEQTLELIYGSVHREAIPDLAEYKFGCFEMKGHRELEDNSDYQAWISDDTGSVPCPGGENKQQFVCRILNGYKLLLEKSRLAGAVLAIGHGGVITYIMDHLFPDVRHFYEWQPEPGRGYMLVYTSKVLQGYKEV